MDLRQLEYFRRVAERRNISIAAAELNITQPSLTKSIKLLEKELGVRLFDRLARGVELTDYGQTLLRHAEAVHVQMTDATAELASQRSGSFGAVSVGAGPAWLRRHLPLAVARTVARYPGIRVKVGGGFDEELFRSLRRGEFDFVVAELPDDRRGLEVRPLASDELGVCCRAGHPLTERRRLAARDLLQPIRGCCCRAPRARSAGWRHCSRRRTSRRRQTVVETSSHAFLLNMVRHSDALTFTVSRTVDIEEGAGLVMLNVPRLKVRREAGIVLRRGGWLSPAAAASDRQPHRHQPRRSAQLTHAFGYGSCIWKLFVGMSRPCHARCQAIEAGGRHGEDHTSSGRGRHRRVGPGLGAPTIGSAQGKVAPITIVINQSPWFDSFRKTVELYEKETGNKVELDVNPFAGSLEKQRNSVRAKQGQYDLLIMNSGWFAEMYFGGFVEALTDIDPGFKLDPDVFTLGDTIYLRPGEEDDGAGRQADVDADLAAHPGALLPRRPLQAGRAEGAGDLRRARGQRQEAAQAAARCTASSSAARAGRRRSRFDFYPYLYGFGGSIFKDQAGGRLHGHPEQRAGPAPRSTTTSGWRARPAIPRPRRWTRPT